MAEQVPQLNLNEDFSSDMKTVYLLLLKIMHQGTVKYNVSFQYIRVKKTYL